MCTTIGIGRRAEIGLCFLLSVISVKSKGVAGIKSASENLSSAWQGKNTDLSIEYHRRHSMAKGDSSNSSYT